MGRHLASTVERHRPVEPETTHPGSLTPLPRSGNRSFPKGDGRLPGALSDFPTAKEQGVDVEGINWRGFYLPPKLSDEDVVWWEDALHQVYESQEWKDVMQQNGLIPFDRSGAEFKAYVEQQIDDIEDISKEVGLIQ